MCVRACVCGCVRVCECVCVCVRVCDDDLQTTSPISPLQLDPVQRFLVSAVSDIRGCKTRIRHNKLTTDDEVIVTARVVTTLKELLLHNLSKSGI